MRNSGQAQVELLDEVRESVRGRHKNVNLFEESLDTFLFGWHHELCEELDFDSTWHGVKHMELLRELDDQFSGWSKNNGSNPVVLRLLFDQLVQNWQDKGK